MSKPLVLMGHFSSIVTTLTAIPGKPWLVSTDREGKIRVNKLPKSIQKVHQATHPSIAYWPKAKEVQI